MTSELHWSKMEFRSLESYHVCNLVLRKIMCLIQSLNSLNLFFKLLVIRNN